MFINRAEEPILRSMVAMLRGRQAPKCGRRRGAEWRGKRETLNARFSISPSWASWALRHSQNWRNTRQADNTSAGVFTYLKPSAVLLFLVDENLICILQSKHLCTLINVLKTTTKWFWVLNMSSFLWSDMCSNWLRYNNAKQQFFFRSISAKHDRVLFERILL